MPRSFTNYTVGTADFILPLNGDRYRQGNRRPIKSFRLASLRSYPEGCCTQKLQVSGLQGPENAQVQEQAGNLRGLRENMGLGSRCNWLSSKPYSPALSSGTSGNYASMPWAAFWQTEKKNICASQHSWEKYGGGYWSTKSMLKKP